MKQFFYMLCFVSMMIDTTHCMDQKENRATPELQKKEYLKKEKAHAAPFEGKGRRARARKAKQRALLAQNKKSDYTVTELSQHNASSLSPNMIAEICNLVNKLNQFSQSIATQTQSPQ